MIMGKILPPTTLSIPAKESESDTHKVKETVNVVHFIRVSDF